MCHYVNHYLHSSDNVAKRFSQILNIRTLAYELDISHSTANICISVYFTKVSQSKTLRDGQFSIHFISLANGPRQTPVKVALFGAAAVDPPSPNNIVLISGVYLYCRHKRTADNDSEDMQTSLGTRQKTYWSRYFSFTIINLHRTANGTAAEILT